MDVENWAKFRYAINIGTDPVHLHGTSIPDEVKSAYRELGKGHYEVVCSLGYCNLAFLDLILGNPFVLHKAVRCVIVSLKSGKNGLGDLVPLTLNTYPELKMEQVDREEHWTCSTLGPDNFRAGCNLATLFYMLHSHLTHCRLSPPSMTAYLMQMLRDFRGARF
jgi:hypothetical protein